MPKLFKLANVYELDSTFDSADAHIRIEIFEDADDKNYRRVKVWAKRNYDVYPTLANIGQSGSDRMYSSDLLAVEITSLITDDLSLLTGKKAKEAQVLQEAIDGIKKLNESLSN
jgi:hypothetical protein